MGNWPNVESDAEFLAGVQDWSDSKMLDAMPYDAVERLFSIAKRQTVEEP